MGVLCGLQDYKDDITMEEAVKLVVKVLSKTLDSTALTPDKVELATISRDEPNNRVRLKTRVTPLQQLGLDSNSRRAE